mgnify:FL=1
MLDLRRLRAEPEAVRAALARRRDGSDQQVDQVLRLDERRRQVLPELEELRARKNEASEAIAAAKRAGDDAAEAIAAMREVSAREKALQGELADVEEKLRAAMAALPNPPLDETPDADTVLREVG